MANKPPQDKIYIASKTKHAKAWRKYAKHFDIVSTWIYEAGVGETSDWPDLWDRCIREASTCNSLVLYREPGEELKGAWVELGAALAAGIPVHAVGIEEFSVRHHRLITHHSDVYEAVLAASNESAR